MRLSPKSTGTAGLALLLAASVQGQYIRSSPGSGSGMRSRDRNSLSGSMMGKRHEMRPGAGEAEQAAGGGNTGPAAATGDEGGDTGGGDTASEVSVHHHHSPLILLCRWVYGGTNTNRVQEVIPVAEILAEMAAVEGAIPST